MKRMIYMIQKSLKENFCRPSDFFDIDWDVVKKSIEIMPFKAILALIILVLVGVLLMVQYYITLPFRLLNEIAQYWCEY